MNVQTAVAIMQNKMSVKQLMEKWIKKRKEDMTERERVTKIVRSAILSGAFESSQEVPLTEIINKALHLQAQKYIEQVEGMKEKVKMNGL